MTGVGSEDVRDANKKMVLAIVWQLVRFHYLQIIGSKTEQDLLNWAGEVSGETLSGFNDEKFKDGKILIKLCAAIEPRVID